MRVGVGVEAAVGVTVAVGVGVTVGVAVAVGVGPAVGAGVAVPVGVGVPVTVGVAVGSGHRPPVHDWVVVAPHSLVIVCSQLMSHSDGGNQVSGLHSTEIVFEHEFVQIEPLGSAPPVQPDATVQVEVVASH